MRGNVVLTTRAGALACHLKIYDLAYRAFGAVLAVGTTDRGSGHAVDSAAAEAINAISGEIGCC